MSYPVHLNKSKWRKKVSLFRSSTKGKATMSQIPCIKQNKHLFHRAHGYDATNERHWSTALRWWMAYFFILWPIRILFGWILPPILRYVWHNGVFYHMAQDDRPVYEGVKCLGEEIPYGNHFRETWDVIIPDDSVVALGSNKSTLDWMKCVLFDIWSLATCYPRACIRYVDALLFPAFKEVDIAPAKKFDAILFVHGGGVDSNRFFYSTSSSDCICTQRVCPVFNKLPARPGRPISCKYNFHVASSVINENQTRPRKSTPHWRISRW